MFRTFTYEEIISNSNGFNLFDEVRTAVKADQVEFLTDLAGLNVQRPADTFAPYSYNLVQIEAFALDVLTDGVHRTLFALRVYLVEDFDSSDMSITAPFFKVAPAKKLHRVEIVPTRDALDSALFDLYRRYHPGRNYFVGDH